jgi:hypothetical protein
MSGDECSAPFQGTGRCFIVAGPTCTLQEYRAYQDQVESRLTEGARLARAGDQSGQSTDPLAALACAGATLLGREEWSRIRRQQFLSALIDRVEECGRALGMALASRHGSGPHRAHFDPQFLSLLDTCMIEVGWRAHGQDIVIGVAPTGLGHWQTCLSDPVGHEQEILLKTGRSARACCALYGAAINGINACLRLALTEGASKPSETTNGPAAQAPAMPGPVAHENQRLLTSVRSALAALEVDAPTALMHMTSREREWLIDAVSEKGGYVLEAPVFNRRNHRVLWINLFDGNVVGESPATLQQGGLDLAQLLRDAPHVRELAPIERNDRTEALFRQRQRENGDRLSSPLSVAVSGKEFSLVTGRDFQVRYNPLAAAIRDALIDALHMGDSMVADAGLYLDALEPSALLRDFLVCQGGLYSDDTRECFLQALAAIPQLTRKDMSPAERQAYLSLMLAAMDIPDEPVSMLAALGEPLDAFECHPAPAYRNL